MADVREMRIFSAEQIEVPQDLPEILKDFSKEVIRSNPSDLVKFSREYFEQKANETKSKANNWRLDEIDGYKVYYKNKAWWTRTRKQTASNICLS